MDRVGFGVIGAGLFGENHALVYSRLPGVELVAVCDQNEERAREVAERYGARAHYTDYAQLLADPDIRAVSIATPDFAHTAIALAAAEAGKHILCEKPLATTVEEAQAVVDTAARAGVKLHGRLSQPRESSVRRRSRQRPNGAIGTPAYGYARLSNTTFVPLEMLSWADRSSALWFLGSHAVDIMRFILNDTVVRVQAVSRSGILQKLRRRRARLPRRHCRIRARCGGDVRTRLDPPAASQWSTTSRSSCWAARERSMWTPRTTEPSSCIPAGD